MNRRWIGVLFQITVFVIEMHGRPTPNSLVFKNAARNIAVGYESRRLRNGMQPVSHEDGTILSQRYKRTEPKKLVAPANDDTLAIDIQPIRDSIENKLNSMNDDGEEGHLNAIRHASAVFADDDSDPSDNYLSDHYYDDYTGDSPEDVTSLQAPAKDDDKDGMPNLRIEFRLAAAPPCATSGRTYCEAIDDYPVEYIESLLQRDRRKMESESEMQAADDRFVSRIGALSDNLTECNSQAVVIYPTRARSLVDGKWSYIIQPADKKQGVRVAICTDFGKCPSHRLLPNGYTSQCVQRFRGHKLLSLDKSGNVIEDLFDFPSHCECNVYEKRQRKPVNVIGKKI